MNDGLLELGLNDLPFSRRSPVRNHANRRIQQRKRYRSIESDDQHDHDGGGGRMSLTTHVEGLDHPDDCDVMIQFTDEQLHHSIELSQDEAETLLTLLRGVVEQ